MLRGCMIGLVLLAVALGTGCASMSSLGGPEMLTQLLTNQLGVTANQAAGGAGSILSLAKEKLSNMAFSSLSSAIPGADALVKSAQSLGAITGPLGNRAGVDAAFGKLGMQPPMVDKFGGVMGDVAAKAGGDPVKALLGALLK